MNVGDRRAGERRLAGGESARLAERRSSFLREAARFAASQEAVWLAIGLAMLGVAVTYLLLAKGTTLWVDELSFYRTDQGLHLKYLLTAYNGQLALVPRLIYAVVFDLFGPNYLVLRLIQIAGVLLIGACVYVLLSVRVPRMVALPAAALVMLLGQAWTVLVPATGIINVYCIAGGLGAMAAIERGRRFDPLAALLLAVSLASWSAGLAFAAGAAVLVGSSPDRRRRAWVVAVPLGLYALWWITMPGFDPAAYGGVVHPKFSHVWLIPNFAASSFAAALSALTGLNYGFNAAAGSAPGTTFPPTDLSWGPALAVAAVGGCFLLLRRERPARWPWAWIVVLITFWATTCLTYGSGRTPTSDRYLYLTAVVLVVLAANLLGRRRLGRRGAMLAAAACVFALGANIRLLGDGARFLRDYGGRSRAQLAAVELGRRHIDRGYFIQNALASSPLGVMSAGDYLAAARRTGSIAESLPALRAAPEADREAADQVLVAGYGLHLAPVSATARSRCRVMPVGRPFRLPGGGALLRSAGGNATVGLGRFGSTLSTSAGSLRPGRYEALRIPSDSAPDPWFAGSGSSHPLTVCRL